MIVERSGVGSRRTRLLSPMLAVSVVVTAGAACQPEPTPTSVVPSSFTPAPATPTTPPPPTSASSTTQTATATPATVLKKIDAGTVTDSRSASASGSGPADLRFTTKGEFAVVVRLDCSRCRGTVRLTSPTRQTPYAEGAGPIEASYLTAVLRNDAPRQSVQLLASGPWKVTFLSWNDLPVQTGRRSGKGSTVIFLGNRASGLQVVYKPAGPEDALSGRLFTVSAKPLIFGADEPLDETYDVELPGVIAIETEGSWTLTPSGRR